ncbi:hypothetical protein P3342_002409 [Pyrenophora teres f. teres]|nr:hypothetical protein P3342_002409 [Pyrenophora teres f. teres]
MWEVDLVQHWHQRQSLGEGEVEVGHGLRLHALARIHQQQCATTAGVTARHLGPKVDVAGRVDKMQQVVLTLVRVYHGACLRLDCDAALALHVQLVEELLLSARLDGACNLQQAVRQRRLAMVDVGDDAEVAVPVDGDLGDALLQLRLRPVSLGIASGGRGEGVREALKQSLGMPKVSGVGCPRPPAVQEAARSSHA